MIILNNKFLITYFFIILVAFIIVVCLVVVLVVTLEVGLRDLKFIFFLPEINWLLHIINAIKHNITNIE